MFNYDKTYTTEGAAEYAMTLFPKEFRGICIDIGANDPTYINNSWIFEEAGWDCYCIEPNPKCIPKLKALRKNVLEYACSNENKDDVDLFVFSLPECEEAAGTGLINHAESDIKERAEHCKTIYTRTDKVKVRTLDWLMENEIKKPYIDFLSIDVEHAEMQVLAGTDLNKWNPQVICIENLEEENIQRDYLGRFGYSFVNRIAFNDFYIQSMTHRIINDFTL